MLKKRLGVAVAEIDWYFVEGSLRDYFKVSSTLIIPKDCERVGRQAFWGCNEIKKVIIPESVKEIGRSAFNLCENLKEVGIPGSVEKIGEFAFCDCKEATIILEKPRSEFKFIGPYAFLGCKDVKEEAGN